MTPPFLLRAMTAADHGFVFSAWEKGAWELSPYRWVSWQRFRRGFGPEAQRKAKDVWVACHPDSPDTLMGFVAKGGPSVVHWVYVVGILRRNGLAASMVRELGLDLRGLVTTMLPTPESFWMKLKSRGMVFDPWA